MGYHRTDIVDRAITVLDEYGLESLTMRRLAAELDVRPSALYHHVPNKQQLLAAVADEILRRGRREQPQRSWDGHVLAVCHELRDAMLAYRDGAEVVVTAYNFGLGAAETAERVSAALRAGNLPDELVDVGTRALLHLVFGHTMQEQTGMQAVSLGAIERAPDAHGDFDRLLGLTLDGLCRDRSGEAAP